MYLRIWKTNPDEAQESRYPNESTQRVSPESEDCMISMNSMSNTGKAVDETTLSKPLYPEMASLLLTREHKHVHNCNAGNRN
jgi:hypothetical protein